MFTPKSAGARMSLLYAVHRPDFRACFSVFRMSTNDYRSGEGIPPGVLGPRDGCWPGGGEGSPLARAAAPASAQPRQTAVQIRAAYLAPMDPPDVDLYVETILYSYFGCALSSGVRLLGRGLCVLGRARGGAGAGRVGPGPGPTLAFLVEVGPLFRSFLGTVAGIKKRHRGVGFPPSPV